MNKCLTKKPEVAKIPCLLTHIASITETHSQLVSVAIKFNLAPASKKRGSKKVAAA